jgi:polyhydroxybutyrate depolymerase
LVLHGGGNTVDDLVKTTQFDRFAATDEFIAAYPEGIGGYWNAGFCCGTASRDGVDDVGFLTALLDRLQSDYRIDRSRVFLAGVSNGAIMAYRFACVRADRVAAVASVAGAMLVEDCQPSRPVSVLEVHGTADTSLPFNGGRVQPRAAMATAPVPPSHDVVRRWAEANGCSPVPATTVRGPVTTTSWAGCGASTRVTLMAVEGGGHTWFASGLGPANGALDATSVVARFFSDARP